MSRLPFLVLVLLSACTPVPGQPEPAPSRSADACPHGVEYDVLAQEAAMGLRVLSLRATNCGAEAVELNGYPSVTVLDAERAPLLVAVGQGSFGISAVTAFDAPPQPVVVGPGESARTGLLWRNTYTDVSAPPAVGEHLEIAVAAGRPAQVYTPLDEHRHPVTLDLGSTGKVGVMPWTAMTP
ncbi:DUF4232 domain-containing protein [Saccharothrix hoggarensis]|uniref:DUF4232 domain-containing protein n=1 Tax=Saccharothrix hoggarensis TaxID=913853 RepID=A0ABW3R0E1_9PSEU